MENQQVITANCSNVLLKYILVFILCLSGFYDLFAQTNTLTKSQKADSALAQAIKLYDRTIGRNSFLYTGKVYVDKYGNIEGHQFFNEDYWELGEIVYEGQHFDSVYLMYDIYNDQLLLEHFNSSGSLAPIKLFNSKISSFKLQGHSFVKFEKDTISGLSDGFYDELFIGDQVEIHVMRKKEIYKSSGTNTVEEVFKERDKFYIKKDGVFYLIKSQRNISKALLDYKKEIKRFIRSNKLFYRQDKERTLVLVARYYEDLKN